MKAYKGIQSLSYSSHWHKENPLWEEKTGREVPNLQKKSSIIVAMRSWQWSIPTVHPIVYRLVLYLKTIISNFTVHSGDKRLKTSAPIPLSAWPQWDVFVFRRMNSAFNTNPLLSMEPHRKLSKMLKSSMPCVYFVNIMSLQIWPILMRRSPRIFLIQASGKSI